MSRRSGMLGIFGRSRRHFPGIPEFSIALFSFLLHSVWEFIQVPAYQGMPLASHWEGILLCFAATVGDVGLALLAFWTASISAGSRSWILYPGLRPRAVFVMAGLGLTIVLEYYHTEITARWRYSDIMPLVPWLGTGLLPLLQWALIPPAVAWLVRRHILSAGKTGSSFNRPRQASRSLPRHFAQASPRPHERWRKRRRG